MDNWWVIALGCIALAAVGGYYFFVACSYLHAERMVNELIPNDGGFLPFHEHEGESRERTMARVTFDCVQRMRFNPRNRSSPSTWVITLAAIAIFFILVRGVFWGTLALPVACIVACQLAKRRNLWGSFCPCGAVAVVTRNAKTLEQIRCEEIEIESKYEYEDILDLESDTDARKASLWWGIFEQQSKLAKHVPNATAGAMAIGAAMTVFIMYVAMRL